MAGIGDILNPASDILGLIEGGVQLFDNLGKEKRDRKALAALKDPFYKIQDEYYQNRNLLAGEAGGGIPAATKDYYTSESQRGLGAGISGELQSGANPNDINRLFKTYNQSIDKTVAEDAEQHIKNIQYFKDVNKDLAGQKTMQWAINEYQPIQEKRRQLSQNIAAEQQNAYGGANTIIGSTGALGTDLQNNSLLNNLFKTPSDDDTALNPYTRRDTTRITNI